jgi:hypothetical protein
LILVALFVLPWLLAFATWIGHHYYRRRGCRKQQGIDRDDLADWITLEDTLAVLKLYKGRVWHTRFRPTRHAFTYPLFIFGVDLSAIDALMSRRRKFMGSGKGSSSKASFAQQQDVEDALMDALWPLSWVLQFRTSDHLKNGEGLTHVKVTDAPTAGESAASLSSSSVVQASFLERIQNLLCSEATKLRRQRDEKEDLPQRRRDDDWDLVRDDRRYRVVLITHLRYYGYCFNPVSFYLILDDRLPPVDVDAVEDRANPIRAVVGEVSNTPWGEMHCYVLLRDTNCDGPSSLSEMATTPGSIRKVRYIFPKSFHVSPFMEMNYNYDWTFAVDSRLESVDIHNSLICNNERNDSGFSAATTTPTSAYDDSGSKGKVPDDQGSTHPKTWSSAGSRQFHARMLVHAASASAARGSGTSLWSIAWHMSCYPAFGMIVQIWIHYQALWLFLIRGVEFQPHPRGTETPASKIIGTMMTPYFVLRERLNDRSRRHKLEISAANVPGSRVGKFSGKKLR